MAIADLDRERAIEALFQLIRDSYGEQHRKLLAEEAERQRRLAPLRAAQRRANPWLKRARPLPRR
jgi:hypothetical protein